MDKAIIQYYRRILKSGFKNAGSYEDASILLNTAASGVRVCGGSGGYIHIYIKVKNEVIEGIKYLCSCDPAANVAVEILCDLLPGKTLAEAAALTEDMFLEAIDGPSEDLRQKAGALIKNLNGGIEQYRTGRS